MTDRTADLRQQPGVCPECKGSCRTGSGYLREDCPACNGTGQQPAQPESGETWANLRAECSYHTNGACFMRACMAKLPDGRFEMPPRFIGCDLYRALKELDRLREDRDAKYKRMWELGHECDRLQSALTAAQRENASLRNLAANLQPGPISEALSGQRYTTETELRDQLTAAQQRIDDLHAALRTYGWHKPECDYMQEELPCTCGFLTAVERGFTENSND